LADVNSPYQIRFSKKAQKDIEKLTVQQKLKLQQLLQDIIAVNPYLGKVLKGDLNGFYSYRLNRKDRIVYEIYEEDKVVLIARAKTHYGD
jgi:toxin YoeB